MRRRVLARSVLVRACLRLSEPSGRFLSRGLFKAPSINILHPITVLHLPRESEQVRDTGREVACILLKERESSGAEHTKRQQASKATTKSHLGGAICDRLPTVFLSSFNKEASERRKRKGCEGVEEGKGATGRGVKQTMLFCLSGFSPASLPCHGMPRGGRSPRQQTSPEGGKEGGRRENREANGTWRNGNCNLFSPSRVPPAPYLFARTKLAPSEEKPRNHMLVSMCQHKLTHRFR